MLPVSCKDEMQDTLNSPLGQAGHSSHLHPNSPDAAGCWHSCGSISRCAAHPLHRAGSSCWQNGSYSLTLSLVCVLELHKKFVFQHFFLLTALRRCLNVQNTVKWKNFTSLSCLNKLCHEPGSSINPGKTALGASQWIFNNTNTTCVMSITRKMGTGLRGCWSSPKLSLEAAKRQLCSEGAVPSQYAQSCSCKKWVLNLWNINKTDC